MGSEKTISTRKISNGVIVRESEWNGDNFKEKETFYPKAPKVEIEAPDGKEENTLTRTKKYMGGG